MKRWIALLIACLLALALLPAVAEESGSPAAGLWYADLGGAAAELALNGDGSYAFSVPGSEPVNGAWKLNDGFVYLDGDENAPLSFDGDRLSQFDAGLFFTREQPETYAPAELQADAALLDYEGAWHTAYVLQNGAVLPASFTDDDTLVYIEESKAVLKGGLFGYILADLTFENGALTYAAGDMTASLELQQDGFLRLTTEHDGVTETCILARSALDEPDEAADR